MKKFMFLMITATLLINLSSAEGTSAVPRDVMKITAEGKSASDHSWYALSGTKKLTEVQFLEAIGNTEYLEAAKNHETKFKSDAGSSALIFLGSIAVAGTGVVLAIVGAATMNPSITLDGAIVGLVAIPGYVWWGIATPKEKNLLGADQAQVLADRYNAGN